MLIFLSQSDIPERISRHLLFWSLVFMGVLVLAWVVIAVAKKKSEGYQQSQAEASMPFSLHDLRRLHAQGQLSDEEFNKAREKIVAMSKAALARDAARKAGVATSLRKPIPQDPGSQAHEPPAEEPGLDQ